MQYIALPSCAAVLAVGLLLAGCAGETDVGGISTSTAEGVLKDANVAGFSYRAGNREPDATGADGSFTYEVGRDVTFYLGDLELGTVSGQAVVTPLDFVRNGSSTSVEVLNRVRLLMLLDEDNDPENGIQISVTLRDQAEATPSIWKPVDFSASEQDFNSELNLIFFSLNNPPLNRPQQSLATFAVAQDHLEGTLRCVHSGGFRGTLAGGDSGNFGALIDAATGLLRGYALRDGSSAMIELDGVQAVSFDQDAFFSSSDAATGVTFTGNVSDPDQIFGEWEHANPQQPSGTFQGERIGGETGAVYRFTATYEGGADAGLYTFDINTVTNNVTGAAYSVTNDSLATLFGTLNSGGNLEVRTSHQPNVIITATVDLAAGTLSSGFDSVGNALTGSGCRLN